MRMIRSRSQHVSSFCLLLSTFLLVWLPNITSARSEEVKAPYKDGEKCVNGICINEEDRQKNVLPEVSSCSDLREDCPKWAEEGLCKINWRWMHPHCPRTCSVCHNRTREVPESDSFVPKSRGWAGDYVIIDAIGADMGEPQIIKNLLQKDDMIIRVEEARGYVHDVVMVKDEYKTVRDKCRNLNESCAQWAIEGKCEDDEEFMDENCAPVCFSCEQLHIEAACPIDPAMKNAWYRGDLNLMFERIVSDPAFEQYSPKVLSRPSYAEGDINATSVDYQTGPWVVVLDDFIKPEECERLIQLGTKRGYKRSTEVGVQDEFGNIENAFATSRTSSNTWCQGECYRDPMVVQLRDRMEHLTGIPSGHADSLQLLQYEEGQYYRQHHDYIHIQFKRMQGVRILTVFLYLNDVEEGGETDFPELNLRVKPRRGSALLWPNVLDDDPNQRDDRTEHAALPVIKGVKYGANAWFHQRDFQYVAEIGCL